MTLQRIEPDFHDDREPVVTYSRIEPRPASRTIGRDAYETVVDAEEVPLVGSAAANDSSFEDVSFDGPRLDLRADRRGDTVDLDPSIADGLFDERRRSRGLRLVWVGAFIAIAAGLGVLAATFGAATSIGGKPEGGLAAATSEPQPEAVSETASLDPAAVEPPEGLREVPLTSDAPADAAASAAPQSVEGATAAPAATPVPRPRPDAGSEAAAAGPAVPDSAVPVLPPPVASAPAPAAPPRVGTPAASRGEDALITDIERTLSRVDSSHGPAPAASAPVPGPVAAPPPAASESSIASLPPSQDPLLRDNEGGYPMDGPYLAAPGEEGPVRDMGPAGQPAPRAENYGYPADNYGYPSSGEQWNSQRDVMPPPPVATPGYPVPPAAVPQAEAYPPDQGWEEPVLVERRPGPIKRAFQKTTDAVGRLFGR